MSPLGCSGRVERGVGGAWQTHAWWDTERCTVGCTPGLTLALGALRPSGATAVTQRERMGISSVRARRYARVSRGCRSVARRTGSFGSPSQPEGAGSFPRARSATICLLLACDPGGLSNIVSVHLLRPAPRAACGHNLPICKPICARILAASAWYGGRFARGRR